MDQKQLRQERKNHPAGSKNAPLDPKNPTSKPNATTQDQVSNMESEGQAQQPGQEPPADIREELSGTPRKSKKG
ncbi:MAG: hypothetical protein JJE40_17480 [Vicinamibacteria bacterium]|nr:hypothetical protein [Vicinamibacteria bacterium]